MMTVQQKRKILIQIRDLEKNISSVKDARIVAATNGYASCSISSSGGAKSYTRMSMAELNSVLSVLEKELVALRGMLFGSDDFGNGGWQTIPTTYR